MAEGLSPNQGTKSGAARGERLDPVSHGARTCCAAVAVAACIVWGCNAGDGKSELVASVQAQRALPSTRPEANAARRAPRPRPTPAPRATEFAPGASDEFDPALLADVHQALRAVDENAFATLIHDEKRVTPNNCQSWRALRTRGYSPKKNALAEQVDAGVLVRCGALEFLARAKASRASYVRDALEDAGPSALPAIVASATSKAAVQSRAAAAAKAMTLAELVPGARSGPSELRGRVTISEPASDTSVIINAEAWGDVNSDEVEDLLLSVLNSSDDASYFDMRLIEVTRAAPGAALTVLAVSQ